MKKFKLDPEVKRKWVTALRSGKYKQGRDFLHTRWNDTYCCLGVAVAEGLMTEQATGDEHVPPITVSTTCGLPFEIINELVAYNDIEKKSFTWIAAVIEKYL